MNVCNLGDGDFIRVRGVDFGKGAIHFEASVSSPMNDGEIEIRLDSLQGEKIGMFQKSIHCDQVDVICIDIIESVPI